MNLVAALFGYFTAFLYLSAITFVFLPTYTTRLLGWFSLFIILCFLLCGFSLRFRAYSALPLVLLFLYSLLTLVAQSWSHNTDLILFFNSTGIFLHVLPGALFLYLLMSKLTVPKKSQLRNNDSDKPGLEIYPFKIILFTFTLLAFFAVLAFFNSDLRAFLEHISVHAGNISPEHPQYEYRVRGILNSAAAGASILYAIGVMCGVYLLLSRRINFVYFIFSCSILLGGIFLSGRSGLFYILGFSCLFIFFYFYKDFLFWSVIPKVSKRFVYIILFSFVLSVVFIYFVFFFEAKGLHYSWLIRDFKYILDGDFSKGTLGNLFGSHLIAPENYNFSRFLLGSQSWYSVDRVPTDIGYLRMIYSNGLLISSLYYFSFIVIFYALMRCARRRETKVFFAVLGVMAFLFEFKEPFLIDLRFTSVYFVFFVFIVVRPYFHCRLQQV